MTRIVVIDDDAALVRSCKWYLRAYEVEAHTERILEVVDRLVEHPPDAVLLDYFLSDTTGGEVIQRLRTRGVDIPILLMSGSFDIHRGEHEFAFGADDVIAKPFTGDALVAKLQRLLTAHAMRHDLARQHRELRELHARRDAEAEAARALLSRMCARGEFDPTRTRTEVIACGEFSGDVAFGAELGDGRYRWMLGDVTGHTLASALVTIPLSLTFYATARKRVPMAELLTTMDEALATLLPASMFCAATLCELDRPTGVLRVWNGGGPPVLVRRGSRVLAYSSQDVPLGVDRRPNRGHHMRTVLVEPGDRIYTFSDGLTEALSPDGRMLGIEPIISTLAEVAPDEGYAAVRALWRGHIERRPLEDDVSFLEVIA